MVRGTSPPERRTLNSIRRRAGIPRLRESVSNSRRTEDAAVAESRVSSRRAKLGSKRRLKADHQRPRPHSLSHGKARPRGAAGGSEVDSERFFHRTPRPLAGACAALEEIGVRGRSNWAITTAFTVGVRREPPPGLPDRGAVAARAQPPSAAARVRIDDRFARPRNRGTAGDISAWIAADGPAAETGRNRSSS